MIEPSAEALSVVDALNAAAREENPYPPAFSSLVPLLQEGNVDVLYARLDPPLRVAFLEYAREHVFHFEATAFAWNEQGWDTAPLHAIREWAYRQPIEWAPPAPLSRAEPTKPCAYSLLQRVFPHLLSKEVEAVLYEISPRYRREFARFAAGMRPGLAVVVATARAHGQDPAPYLAIDAWERTLPEAEKVQPPRPTVKVPVRPATAPPWLVLIDQFNADYLNHDQGEACFSSLAPYYRVGVVDEMFEAMLPGLRPYFLDYARDEVFMFDEFMVGYRSCSPKEVRAVLREWICRQPFRWAPWTERFSGGDFVPDFLPWLFPQLSLRSVEDVLRNDHERWARRNLFVFLANVRPVVDELVATCNAHGQDPTPILELVAWDDALRRARKHRFD